VQAGARPDPQDPIRIEVEAVDGVVAEARGPIRIVAEALELAGARIEAVESAALRSDPELA
jgi:hypothetical protein